MNPPTFLTRDATGAVRAYNDQGQRCPLASAPDGTPLIDIQPEVPQAEHAARENREYREGRERDAVATRLAREAALRAADEETAFRIARADEIRRLRALTDEASMLACEEYQRDEGGDQCVTGDCARHARQGPGGIQGGDATKSAMPRESVADTGITIPPPPKDTTCPTTTSP